MHTMHTFVNKFVLQHIFITKKKEKKKKFFKGEYWHGFMRKPCLEISYEH